MGLACAHNHVNVCQSLTLFYKDVVYSSVRDIDSPIIVAYEGW